MSINSIYAFIIALLMTSCYSTRKTTYFNELKTDTVFTTTIINKAAIIQKNDIISIVVNSLNTEASEVYNNLNPPGAYTTVISGTTGQAYGYLVDQAGYIQFPLLGSIKAEGLTTKELKDTLQKEIIKKKLLLDPIVSVRYLNFKISIMGEVEHPSVYNIPNEKITLLEALSLAGDMTVFSKRNNVLVIREEDGQKKLARLNLRSSELFTSPYYYLKSNDIVYVEHNRAKVANSKSLGPWISAIFSGSSLLIVIIDKIIINQK